MGVMCYFGQMLLRGPGARFVMTNAGRMALIVMFSACSGRAIERVRPTSWCCKDSQNVSQVRVISHSTVYLVTLPRACMPYIEGAMAWRTGHQMGSLQRSSPP